MSNLIKRCHLKSLKDLIEAIYSNPISKDLALRMIDDMVVSIEDHNDTVCRINKKKAWEKEQKEYRDRLNLIDEANY